MKKYYELPEFEVTLFDSEDTMLTKSTASFDDIELTDENLVG